MSGYAPRKATEDRVASETGLARNGKISYMQIPALDVGRSSAFYGRVFGWTNRDDGIANFLAAHGRYGIPFYMLYRPNQPPHVFGELLSKENVLDVLQATISGS